MLEKLKANFFFHVLLHRPNIQKAYAMVKPEDSWYDTISKVHRSLEEIRQLPHQTMQITSHDGLRLNAVYYPGESDNQITVICVHGYTSHAEREWAFPGLFYHSLGCNVLIPYQRAHGPSQGKYISFGALEHRDVMQWVAQINRLHPDGKILIHGLSMGGGIVLNLADKKMENVKCLIADAPTPGIEAAFRSITGSVFKKDADQVFPHVMKRFQKEFHSDAAEFDGLKNVAGGKYPLLLAAGSNEHLEDLFESLKKNNPQETQVLILPGCDHGNGMYKQTQLFQSTIRDFIFRYL